MSKNNEIEYTSSSTMDWIIFIISTILCIGLLIFWSEWFWVMLPFVFTYLVKALKVM